NGLPPAAMRPTNMNWDAPANTTTDRSVGSHRGRPELTVIVPNETPTIATATQTSAMSRASRWSRVRHNERIAFYTEQKRPVRQAERIDWWSERMTQNSGAPLDVIAVSLQRERRRAGLSLTEVARRAGVAKSTLSQLEAGTGNPSVETLWALGVALEVPFSRLVDPPTAPVHVLRAGEGTAIASERAPFASTLLAACPPGVRRDLHVITAEP